VIANDEKKLEVLEARRTDLLQELDHVDEEIVRLRAELDKANNPL
jgi:predicted RNase H-like nuclease (RuvC/YqgF family)